jgi:hypothetical protein
MDIQFNFRLAMIVVISMFVVQLVDKAFTIFSTILIVQTNDNLTALLHQNLQNLEALGFSNERVARILNVRLVSYFLQ